MRIAIMLAAALLPTALVAQQPTPQPTPTPTPTPTPVVTPPPVIPPPVDTQAPAAVTPAPAVAATPAPAAQDSAHAIRPGMTAADVEAAWGKPVATRTEGNQTYFFYRNDCLKRCGTFDVVFLQDGQVVDAIVRASYHRYDGTSSSPADRKPAFTPPAQ